ncbi:MAG: winged helix-turn-helix transcriptional regulator [Proteobacteria bacterium]|nr:winged helix-turn-helix transcriptional regulator [Pseudomonadota bacterium]
MNEKGAVTALAALAQESRLAVFRLLVQRGPEGYPAGEISARLAIPGPTLSFHLKELAMAGLVAARKDGRFIYYSPSFERMRELVGYLTDNCCSLAATCAPECAAPVVTRRKSKAA